MRSSLPGTPVNGLLGLLPDFEGLTPGNDSINASALSEEDELGGRSFEFDPVPNGHDDGQSRFQQAIRVRLTLIRSHTGVRTIPHSSSSYDLRSRAITPGTNGTPSADNGISRTCFFI